MLSISIVVPVELTTFSGTYFNGSVNLQWITATELNNFGFEVERRDEFSGFEKMVLLMEMVQLQIE